MSNYIANKKDIFYGTVVQAGIRLLTNKIDVTGKGYELNIGGAASKITLESLLAYNVDTVGSSGSASTYVPIYVNGTAYRLELWNP